MNRRARFSTALSMIAVAAALAGCATGPSRESIFGSKVDRSNIGLATRAQAALAKGDFATAVRLAERAVENSPNDAGFRALLGNIYFASGRFASAEAAYSDSLALIPQPELMLKLALVQVAQGKKAEALSVLATARNILEPANYGLALALAGRPEDAVSVLDQVARAPGADARVRQNLALAYALAGDWVMARTVAAQDVPAGQLDARIEQWMAMATPARPSDQVAALTGVTPAVDPGQPERLALRRAPKDNRAYAYAVTVPEKPQPQPQPQQFEVAAALPPPALAEPMPEPQSVPAPEPASAVVEAAPAPAEVEAAPAPAVVEAPSQPAPQPEAALAVVEAKPAPFADEAALVVAEAVQLLVESPAQPQVEESAAIEAPVVAAAAAPVPELPTTFDAPVSAASHVAPAEAEDGPAKQVRKANGRSSSVVQLGAYSSPESVAVAWDRLTKKYPALREYTPMRARFEGPKGTVWRLSVKGFASQRQAISRCNLLKSRGGSCFVRKIAGDAPVQFASR